MNSTSRFRSILAAASTRREPASRFTRVASARALPTRSASILTSAASVEKRLSAPALPTKVEEAVATRSTRRVRRAVPDARSSRRETSRNFTLASALAADVSSQTCSGDACACSGQAQYRVEFAGKWTKPGDFDLAFPGEGTGDGDAHWSPLVGATFPEGGAFWKVGAAVSEGVQIVAETGDPTTLLRELGSDEIYLSPTTNGAPVWAPYEMEIAVTADADHSYLGIVTMVAPTPDYISGASAIPLCGEAGWKDEFSMALKAYDAGTADGVCFGKCGGATVPKGVVEVMKCGTGIFCASEGEVDAIATVTVTRVK